MPDKAFLKTLPCMSLRDFREHIPETMAAARDKNARVILKSYNTVVAAVVPINDVLELEAYRKHYGPLPNSGEIRPPVQIHQRRKVKLSPDI